MTPIAKAILGEADLPKPPPHWGNLPGYGEPIADPKKIPPYTEDLGGGVTRTVQVDGTEEWKLDGKRHRDGDLPAVVLANGSKWWYQDGNFHRDGDKPAIISADGAKVWYQHGKRHREGDKPAVILANGTYAFYCHDKNCFHRRRFSKANPEQLKAWGYNDE